MTKVAITGHRPEQLPNVEWVRETLAAVLKSLNPEVLYQGMAAGADLLSAEVSHEVGIPFVACRPWKTHTARIEDRELYQWALDNAQEVVNVTESNNFDGPQLYHIRNEYMVDHADIVVAIWSGSSKGGTAACVRYAKRKDKTLIQLNPETQQVIYLTEPSLF